jgi:hypothetical protein
MVHANGTKGNTFLFTSESVGEVCCTKFFTSRALY